MNPLKNTPRESQFMFFSILFFVSYLLYISSQLGIDFFDAFSNFINSKSIGHFQDLGYKPTRALISPLFFSPLFFLEKLLHLEDFAFKMSHILAALVFAGFLLFFYKLLKLYCTKQMALFGSFLCSLNPLLIHQAPFAKEDILSLFFLTLTFYFYLKHLGTQKIKHIVITGILMGVTMGTRYNLAPLLYFMIAANELLTQTPIKHFKTKVVCYFFLPLFILFFVPMVIFPLMGRATFLGSIFVFLNDLRIQFNNIRGDPTQNPMLNYIFLLKSFTIPLIFLSFLGFIECCRKRPPGALFFGLWFFVMFILQTYLIAGKESRYLFPVFPPLYFFILHGLNFTSHLIKKKSLKIIFLFSVLIIPYGKAAHELLKFQDPFYRDNKEKEASLTLEKNQSATNSRLFWLGEAYTFFPEDHLFDEGDRYTYIYHFYFDAVEFYASKKPAFIKMKKTEDNPLFQKNLILELKEGDLLIDSEKVMYNTKTLPSKINPLALKKAHLLNFTKASKSNNSAVFSLEQGSMTQLTFSFNPNKKQATLTRGALPAGEFAVLIESENHEKIYFGNFDNNTKEILFYPSPKTTALSKHLMKTQKLFLLSFETLKIFSPSSTKTH